MSSDSASEPIMEIGGLKKHFEQADSFLDRILGGSGRIHAVDGVDLEIHPGETLAVVGESGCGKTTLGQTLLRLEEPTEGSIQYKGTDITDISDSEMRGYRRQLQMVYQDPEGSLNPRKTVGEILRAPLRVHGIGDDKEDRRDMVKQMLTRVGLKSNHINRHPRQFSGGQQQRLGIARALMVRPEVIVADEPTSALDVSVQAQVLNLLGDLQEEMNLTMLFITHDLSVVRHTADRVVVMYLGQIVERGRTEEIFQSPQHPYTKSLLSSVPRIDSENRSDRVLLKDSVPSPVNPPNGCRFHTRCPVIVPPDDWQGDQESFRTAFDFRTRITSGDIDVDAIRTRLDSDGESSDPERVSSYLIDRAFDGELATLSTERVEGIREAATELGRGNVEQARVLISEALPSPCEMEEPPVIQASDTHGAACVRLGPMYNSQP